MITSKDNERLKLVRKLHDKRWRDKLGLFFVEGEDAVAAATARAGRPAVGRRGRRAAAARGRRERAARSARDRRLPARRSAGVGGARRDARALARLRPRQRRHPDPDRRGVRRGGRALGRLRRPDLAEGAARERRLDLAGAGRWAWDELAGQPGRARRARRRSRCRRSTCRGASCSCSAPSGRACRPRSSATSTRRSRSPAPSR